MLGRLRDNLTTHSANVVYISLIRPILEYCDTLWGCCGEGNSQAFKALQKRAGRIVAKTSRSSPAMDILKWPALAERRRKHVFQLVKKCIEGRHPQYFDKNKVAMATLFLTTRFTRARLDNVICFIYLP